MVSIVDFDGKATNLNCSYLHINFEQKYLKPAIVAWQEHVVYRNCFWTIYVHNKFSPCSTKRRASDKDLTVQVHQPLILLILVHQMMVQHILTQLQTIHLAVPKNQKTAWTRRKISLVVLKAKYSVWIKVSFYYLSA